MRNQDLLKEFRGSYSASPAKHKSEASALGISRRAVILGLGAGGVAVTAFTVIATQKPTVGAPISNVLRIILLDSSDRNTASTDRNITQYLERRAIDDLREGDRLVLLELTANPTEPVIQKFNSISPPRGEDVSGWSDDPYTTEQAWLTSFKERYIRETQSMRQVLEKSQTPLLEALMAVSTILQAYDAERKEVIIVSDGLQHVSNGGLTAYGAASSSRNVYGMPERLTEFYQPDYMGAKITMIHVQRIEQQRRQGKGQREWFHRIFEGYNAAFEYIPT